MKKFRTLVLLVLIFLLLSLLSACRSGKETCSAQETELAAFSSADGTIRLLPILEAATLRAVLINDGRDTLYCLADDIILQQKKDDTWLSVEQTWKHKHPETENKNADEYAPIEAQKSLTFVIYLDEYAFSGSRNLCRLCVPLYNADKTFLGYITEEFSY